MEKPSPPSKDFFSSKIKFISVLFPAPVLPIKIILIKTGEQLSASLLINISLPSEFQKENSSPNSL